jgi:hypothetical protein
LREKHPAPPAIIAVGLPESGFGLGFLGSSEPIIDPKQHWQHQERGERRPVQDATHQKEKEAGVLRMTYGAIQPSRHQVSTPAMNLPPTHEGQGRAADDQQLPHDIESDGRGVAPAQQKRPGVTMEMILGEFYPPGQPGHAIHRQW